MQGTRKGGLLRIVNLVSSAGLRRAYWGGRRWESERRRAPEKKNG